MLDGDEPGAQMRLEQKRRLVHTSSENTAGADTAATPREDARLRAASTVWARTGYPLFRPLGEITPEELESALKQVLEFYAAGNIRVDFAEEVSGADRYRFLTETLPDQELLGAEDDGCVRYWLYREFPPSDVTEAIFSAEQFLEGLFRHTPRLLLPFLGGFDRGADDITRRAGLQLKRRCEEFMCTTSRVAGWTMTRVECTLGQDRAIVRSHVEWTGWDRHAHALLSHAGACVIHLLRCAYGGWDVVELDCPGVR